MTSKHLWLSNMLRDMEIYAWQNELHDVVPDIARARLKLGFLADLRANSMPAYPPPFWFGEILQVLLDVSAEHHREDVSEHLQCALDAFHEAPARPKRQTLSANAQPEAQDPTIVQLYGKSKPRSDT